MSEQDKTPAQEDKPLPIIHIDDDPHDADWLRHLDPRRIKHERQKPKKEKPSNGRQPQQ